MTDIEIAERLAERLRASAFAHEGSVTLEAADRLEYLAHELARARERCDGLAERAQEALGNE